MLIPRFHPAEIGISLMRWGEWSRQLFLLRAPPVILKGSQAKTADKAHGAPLRLYLLHSQQIAPQSVCLAVHGVFISTGDSLVRGLARA